MHPLSLILFCNQSNLRGNPIESWAFDQMEGTTYLEIILDRWRRFGEISKIYLIADSVELATKLAAYQDEGTRVRVMNHNSYRPLGLHRARIYNSTDRSEECIASWVYQIMKSDNEEMVFVDSILHGHVNFTELMKLRRKLSEKPGHCYSLVGDLGYEGVLLDLTFAQNCVSNPNYDGLKFDHPDNLNFGHLYNYTNHTSNRSLISLPDSDWSLYTKPRWKFFKDFYSQIQKTNDFDVFSQFLEYFRLHKSQLESTDLMQVEIECVDHLGEISDSVIDQLILNSLPFGRLTFVLRNLDKHSNGDLIVEKLYRAGLHIYASINGHRPSVYYENIYKYSHVINFELFAHNPELHLKRFPQDNAHLIFQNYLQALLISQKFQRMAVGVTYKMPEDVAEACQAILFFRERQSINPLFDSSGTRPGGQKPHIEFLRIIPASNSLYESPLCEAQQTLIVNSLGQYHQDVNCCDMNFEEYLEQYGFDGDGLQ